MKKAHIYLFIIFAIVLVFIVLCGVYGSKLVTVVSENMPLGDRTCFIIDAGHGGVDGGAVSCTGAYESHINLSIALRLNDLLHLIGYKTIMIRASDISVYTSGESIAAKKASDLKERVRIVNGTENGILLSIHQNHYYDSFYSGAQVFYPSTTGSQQLALQLQNAFVANLNPESNRKIKPTEGIYLMKHIEKTGVLIECGFLSNYEEESKLRSPEYQKNICCVIASACSIYLNNQQMT